MQTNKLLLQGAYLSGLIGTLLVWRYGLPRKDINRSGAQALILEQEDEGMKKEWVRYDLLSHIGLLLIALSFLLQKINLGF